jgi:hypothetical protein
MPMQDKRKTISRDPSHLSRPRYLIHPSPPYKGKEKECSHPRKEIREPKEIRPGGKHKREAIVSPPQHSKNRTFRSANFSEPYQRAFGTRS